MVSHRSSDLQLLVSRFDFIDEEDEKRFSFLGFLKDYTKKYDLAFIIGGTMIIIAAFFHIALVFFEPEKIENEEEENKNETRTKVVA